MNRTHFNETNGVSVEADHLVTPTTVQALDVKPPLWSVIVLEIYFLIVFVIGIAGNTIIIRVMASERKRSSTDWFILFLAISDIICSSITVPMSMVNNLPKHVVFLPSVVCKIHLFVYISTYLTSMLFFILLGIDRYLKICHPGVKNYIADRPCLVGSLVTLIVMILGANRFRTIEVNSNGICLFDSIDKVNIQSLIISSALTLLCFAVCVMYYKVIVKMKTVACQQWNDSTPTSSHNQGKQNPSRSRIFPSDSGTMRSFREQASTSHCGEKSGLSTNLQSQGEPSQKSPLVKEGRIKVMSSEKEDKEIKAVSENRSDLRHVTINSESVIQNQGDRINYPNHNVIIAANSEERNKMAGKQVSFVRNKDENIGSPECFQQQKQRRNVIKASTRNTNILDSTRVLVFMTVMYIVFTIIPLDIVMILIACQTIQFLEGFLAMLFLSKLFYVNVAINVFIYYKLRTGFRTKVRKFFPICRRQIPI